MSKYKVGGYEIYYLEDGSVISFTKYGDILYDKSIDVSVDDWEYTLYGVIDSLDLDLPFVSWVKKVILVQGAEIEALTEKVCGIKRKVQEMDSSELDKRINELDKYEEAQDFYRSVW